MPTLRPYQNEGTNFLLRRKRALLADDMGLGKTAQAIAALKYGSLKPALVVCPATLKFVWHDEVEKWEPGWKVQVVKSGSDPIDKNADVVVVNYDLLVKKRAELLGLDYKAIVLDECFPWGTMVHTDHGPIEIGRIVDEQLDVKVLSVDTETGEYDFKSIARYVKKSNSDPLVRIHHEQGHFDCTPNHPIWVEGEGYVRAEELRAGHPLLGVWDTPAPSIGLEPPLLLDAMCDQSEGIEPEEEDEAVRPMRCVVLGERGEGAEILLDVVQRNVANVSAGSEGESIENNLGGACLQPWAQAAGRIEADVRDELRPGVQVQGGGGGSGMALEEPNVAQPEWRTGENHGAPEHLGEGPWVGDEHGVHHQDESNPGQDGQPAKLVCRGHRVAGEEDCRGGGREQSPHEAMEIPGCSEGGGPQVARVVRVEVLERGSSGGPDGVCGEGSFVYNLEVTDNHNYFADGILVSNCHYIKNPKAQRTRVAIELAWRIPYRFLLTGTPVINKPIELVPLLKCMGRLNEFGGWHNFTKRYAPPRTIRRGGRTIKVYDGADNLRELNQRLTTTCMIRRTKGEVLKELPRTQRITIPLDIDNRAEYQRCENDLKSWLMEQAIDADTSEDEDRWRDSVAAIGMNATAEALTRITYLKQVAARGKVKQAVTWIRDFLEDTDRKLVVFGWHRDVLQSIADAFPDAVTVRGGDTQAHREKAVKDFQNNPKHRLLIGNIKAAGVGLTLTAASDVMFVETSWSPADLQQAIDRVNRMGQDADRVFAYFLVARDTIEKSVLAKLNEKTRIIREVTGDG